MSTPSSRVLPSKSGGLLFEFVVASSPLSRVSPSKSGGLLFEFVSGSKASIFVRKTLQVRLRDRKMQSILQARREGSAFFDEDDACAGLGASMQPV